VEVDLSIQEFYFSQRTIFLNEGDKVVLKVSNYDYQRDFSIPDLNYSASLPVNSTATFNFTAKPGNYWFAVMNQYEAHPQLTGRILVGGVIG
jgi:heme/copper-type cytochrome/quinol oxidase subunit 2